MSVCWWVGSVLRRSQTTRKWLQAPWCQSIGVQSYVLGSLVQSPTVPELVLDHCGWGKFLTHMMWRRSVVSQTRVDPWFRGPDSPGCWLRRRACLRAVVGLLVVKTRVQWVLGQVLAPGGLAGSCLSRLQGCGCPGAHIHLLVDGARTHDVLGLLPTCWWVQVLGSLNTWAQWS